VAGRPELGATKPKATKAIALAAKTFGPRYQITFAVLCFLAFCFLASAFWPPVPPGLCVSLFWLVNNQKWENAADVDKGDVCKASTLG